MFNGELQFLHGCKLYVVKSTLSGYWWSIKKGNCKTNFSMLLKKKEKKNITKTISLYGIGRYEKLCEKTTRIWNRTNFDLCNNVYNQCLQETVKLTFTHKLQMNYLQRNNWTHLLKCYCAINLSYKVLGIWKEHA